MGDQQWLPGNDEASLADSFHVCRYVYVCALHMKIYLFRRRPEQTCYRHILQGMSSEMIIWIAADIRRNSARTGGRYPDTEVYPIHNDWREIGFPSDILSLLLSLLLLLLLLLCLYQHCVKIHNQSGQTLRLISFRGYLRVYLLYLYLMLLLSVPRGFCRFI